MANLIVKFDRSREGGPITRIEGRASFPERKGRQPEVGEEWEVEIAGGNAAGTVNFLRLMKKVEPEKSVPPTPPAPAPAFVLAAAGAFVPLPPPPPPVWSEPSKPEYIPTNGPATILVVGYSDRSEVTVNGRPVALPQGSQTVKAENIAFHLPCRGRMQSAANKVFRLSASVYVLFYEAYNAAREPLVQRTEGLKEVFSYGDDHGMRWAALYKVEGEVWSVDWDVSRSHRHGWDKKRVIGTRTSFERRDDERVLEEAPLV
jgi:hypothetical protein